MDLNLILGWVALLFGCLLPIFRLLQRTVTFRPGSRWGK
jgi:hypothetical protein